MTIEIGKTYEARNGSKFKAVALTGRTGTFAVRGEDENGRMTWWSIEGRFTDRRHDLDLVREAVDADRDA